MISEKTFIAVNRFGLGAGDNDVVQASKNQKSWLYSQMAGYNPAPSIFKHMPSTADAVADSREFIMKNKAMMNSLLSETKRRNARKSFTKEANKTLATEIALRTEWGAKTPTPFMERMVHFWSNHFTVSVTRHEVLKFAGSYEREVIRPNILGKFSDMVIAVIRHPAMLLYLDNMSSIGPNSWAGKRRNKGLNENLARELLELHILGVNGGYTQQDVQELAKMLTGWTIDKKKNSKHKNGYYFEPRTHEPGSKTLMGKTYKENGVHEVELAVKRLCSHPSTARFLATKLARHFVADNPPESAIRKLEQAYMRSNGDLKVITKALIDISEAWKNPLAKVKKPNELIISTLRTLGGDILIKPKQLVHLLNNLNQRGFSAPSPAGWDDRAESWISPEAVIRRIEWCRLNAHKKHNDINIEVLLAKSLGGIASAKTRFAVLKAPSKVDALTLLLASPEFQRR